MTMIGGMANVTLTRDGHVAQLRMRSDGPVITLSRPFTAELAAALDEVDGDRDVRCVVLVGTGRSFVVGADIKEMEQLSTEERLAHNEQLIAMTNHLAALRVPTVACINGYALGGGLEVALACSIRVAADTAKVGLPEVKLGILPGAGGTIRLPRTIGSGAAMLTILTGRTLMATQAERIGLVDVVVGAEEAEAAAMGIAHEIAACAPLAVQTVVAAIRAAEGVTTERAVADVQSRLRPLLDSEDAREGIAAFLQKRAPEFRAR